MYAIRIPSVRSLSSRAGHAVSEWFRERLIRFSYRRRFCLIRAKWLGIISLKVEDHPGEWHRIEGRFVDVWKEGIGKSDLFDGFSDYRDLWRYRGWCVYVVRIGYVQLSWESGLSLAIKKRRLERQQQKALSKYDSYNSADA